MTPPPEPDDDGRSVGGWRSTKTYSHEIDPESQDTSHGIVISMVGTDKRVLEVDCGVGFVSRHLIERGNEVVGIDVDPAAVSAAREVVSEVHCCDLDVVAASSVVTGPFDVIVLADVLEHVREPQAVLADLLGLLADDGRVVLSIPNVAHIDVRLMLLFGEWGYQPLGLLDDSHLRWFTRRSIADLLRAAGLEPLAVRRTVCPGVRIGTRRATRPGSGRPGRGAARRSRRHDLPVRRRGGSTPWRLVTARAARGAGGHAAGHDCSAYRAGRTSRGAHRPRP